MDVLVDTNILLRTLTPQTPHGDVARSAIRRLRRDGRRLCVVPQTIMEFWSVCTRARPPQSNGLGLSCSLTDRYVHFVEGFFEVLPDHPEIYEEWRRLVVSHGVVGRQVFDARLVSAMTVHGVSHVLTFNGADFERYPQIQVLHPGDGLGVDPI